MGRGRARRGGLDGGEKESLHAALDRHRDAVLWKLEGLDEDQLRRPVAPSGMTLLGLVKHLAGAELGWFCLTFGRGCEPLPFEVEGEVEGDEASDWYVAADESAEDILDFYARARTAADEAIEGLDIDATGTAFAFFDGATVSLRWVLIHMLEEVARHAGHADILRESVDGFTGDHNWG
ncbi:DinB family protein [Streptomyces sp. NPDC059002]|uniref:DinB family protein n=1 Tax=Streptomyces sp. NPDC059002 TaxID=3346690 RepID=UPI0036B706E2